MDYLNTDLKIIVMKRYNNRSKVYRIIVPTKEGLKHQGFEDLTNHETAMQTTNCRKPAYDQ